MFHPSELSLDSVDANKRLERVGVNGKHHVRITPFLSTRN